jgi:hypothetical protein
MDSNLILENRIEELRVFGDKAATDKYGDQGKEGVIEIDTKTNYKRVTDTIPKVDTIYWIKNPEPPAKRSPTQAQLTSWQDSKMYGVWLDGKRISNNELSKYQPSDFGLYYVSKLSKNAVVQIDLFTHKYYEKVYMNSTSRKPFLVREITRSGNITTPAQPLIVINGDPMPGLTMETIKKNVPENTIVTQSILNEQDAVKKYGEKGKYGAIELTGKYWDDDITNMTIYKNDSTTKVTDKNLDDLIGKIDTYHPDSMNLDDNKVFVKVEVEAAFRGGEKEWRNFLNRNLDVNVPVKKGCKPGTYTVVVQFIVAKDGRVSDVRALTNHGFGMEEEAIRMIKKGPDWLPAIQNGHNVKAYRKQPFTFVITKPITNVGNIPIEKVRSIEQEKTNSTQILTLFGEPGSKTIDNNDIYWKYTNGSAQLDIQFERSTERVINFHFATIINPVKRNVEYDKVRTIKQGQSTLAELEKMYGLPYKLEIDNNNESWYYEGHNSRLAVLSTNRKSGVISDLHYNN